MRVQRIGLESVFWIQLIYQFGEVVVYEFDFVGPIGVGVQELGKEFEISYLGDLETTVQKTGKKPFSVLNELVLVKMGGIDV